MIRPGRVVPNVSLQWDFTPSTAPAMLVESLSLGAGGRGEVEGGEQAPDTWHLSSPAGEVVPISQMRVCRRLGSQVRFSALHP